MDRATLHVSVELDDTRTSTIQSDSSSKAVAKLLDVFAHYEVAATWAIATLEVETCQSILSRSPRHEIAILGNRSWITPGSTRIQFGRELAQRVEAVRAVGASASTIVLSDGELSVHHDLVIKQGITTICQGRRGGRVFRPEALRFGLWSFPVSAALPGDSRILRGGGGVRRARIGIENTMAAGGCFQLSIDATQVAARVGALHAIERLLRFVARQANCGKLSVKTFSATAAALARQHQGRPTQSILRAA